ncbi:MAG: hypothetical protein E3J72_06505 [Planctomycetota bacterium]|nr:MAG: hypothetical protein E3J72_06505 [Planctomycetota bacterium]
MQLRIQHLSGFFFGLMASLLLPALIAGCDNDKDRKKKLYLCLALSQAGTGTCTDPGYVSGTDRWYVSFDNVALLDAFATLGLPADNAGEFKEKCLYYMRQFYNGVPISFSTEP